MFELLEKTVLTGLGFVSMSQKKTEELLNEFKEKYKVSEEEGKAFLEKMQSAARENRNRIVEMSETEVRKVIDRLGVVTREEFERLEKRVAALERLKKDTDQGEPC